MSTAETVAPTTGSRVVPSTTRIAAVIAGRMWRITGSVSARTVAASARSLCLNAPT